MYVSARKARGDWPGAQYERSRAKEYFFVELGQGSPSCSFSAVVEKRYCRCCKKNGVEEITQTKDSHRQRCKEDDMKWSRAVYSPEKARCD